MIELQDIPYGLPTFNDYCDLKRSTCYKLKECFIEHYTNNPVYTI